MYGFDTKKCLIQLKKNYSLISHKHIHKLILCIFVAKL